MNNCRAAAGLNPTKSDLVASAIGTLMQPLPNRFRGIEIAARQDSNHYSGLKIDRRTVNPSTRKGLHRVGTLVWRYRRGPPASYGRSVPPSRKDGNHFPMERLCCLRFL